MFIDKAYRGRGIGRVLIEQLIKLLGKEPYDMLEVASGMQRAKAHEFYKECGFEQSHYKFTKRGNKGLTY